MEEKKISVISIIYKVEPYLRECIESLVNQTYQNMEIILSVGEGDDACVSICREYEQKDSRVKVVVCKPAGVSDARNHGLELVTGDYLGFVDGDDWIEPDMYETLVHNLKQYKSDIAVCGRFYEFSNATKQDTSKEPIVLNPSEAFRMILTGGGFFLHCWDKLFTKEVFEGITFPIDKHVEDRVVVNKLLDRAERIVYDPTPKYHFRERADSLSKQEHMVRMNTIANVELAEYVDRVHPELKDTMQSFMVYEHITSIQNLMLEGSREVEEIRSHRDYLKENLSSIKRNPKVSKKIQLKLWMAIHCPGLLTSITRKRMQQENDKYVRFKL